MGPFNLTSHSVLTVAAGATISGSRAPSAYPIVTQLPLDEAFRHPWMRNRQYQALVSAYGARNVTLRGGGFGLRAPGARAPPLAGAPQGRFGRRGGVGGGRNNSVWAHTGHTLGTHWAPAG